METPPGRGPEMHVHLAQNEFFFLLQGSIGIQCGTDKFVLKTGDSFMAPLGVPHAYVTLSQQPAHILNVFDPAGDMEAYFAKLATIIRPDGPPDAKQVEANYADHGMKMVGPPLRTSSFPV